MTITMTMNNFPNVFHLKVISFEAQSDSNKKDKKSK